MTGKGRKILYSSCQVRMLRTYYESSDFSKGETCLEEK